MSLEERLAAEYRAAQRMRAAERGALVKFAGLYHSSSTDETMSLHRDSCRDIKREAEEHGSNIERFEEETVTAALDHMVDEELVEMGYDHNSVKVHNCTKETTVAIDPTDASGANGATDRKPGRKPAPVSVRHDPSIIRKPATKPAPKTARKATVTKKAAETVIRKGPARKASTDGVNLTTKAAIEKVVKLKQSGQTIKEIAEAFGMPAEQRSWFQVSQVWRTEADRRNLNRPRRSK